MSAASDMAELELRIEGGRADVVGDLGGLTSIGGQTRAWLEQVYRRPVTDAEIEALTPQQAALNIELWLEQTGMEQLLLADRVDGFAASVIDFAYQSGEATALPALQRILAIPTTAPHVGPLTLAALQDRDRRSLELRMTAARLRFEGAIFQRDYTQSAVSVLGILADAHVDAGVIEHVRAYLNTRQEKFAAGWLNRIAGLLEHFADVLITAPTTTKEAA